MDEVIILDNVFKKIGKREILKGVTLNVKKGDIFGYLGPNGAGKTTTIRIILGLMSSTSGQALILQHDAREDRIRQKIGFVLESDGLYENISAFDFNYKIVSGIDDERFHNALNFLTELK